MKRQHRREENCGKSRKKKRKKNERTKFEGSGGEKKKRRVEKESTENQHQHWAVDCVCARRMATTTRLNNHNPDTLCIRHGFVFFLLFVYLYAGCDAMRLDGSGIYTRALTAAKHTQKKCFQATKQQ